VTSSGYRERPARPGLGLACTWTQSPAGGAEPYVQRVVPDGCMDLIWWERTGDIQVAGPDTGPHLAELVPGERLVAVRFRPGMAPPVLGRPADAVRDGRVPLRELWGVGAEALSSALASATDPERVLQDAVAGRMRPPDPIVPALVASLAGATPVREAADRLGLSERQLRRRSLSAFGYPPKVLQRILRFQEALSLARRGVPYAQVAAVAGYADQAHLAREIRDLAGVTITELLGR
jgi:AraC-like DNA-binding protein